MFNIIVNIHDCPYKGQKEHYTTHDNRMYYKCRHEYGFGECCASYGTFKELCPLVKEGCLVWNPIQESDDVKWLRERNEKLSKEVERMRNLLEDVVNELSLSDFAIEEHGPRGTPPAELVKLVLEQKDMQIALLQRGFRDVTLRKPEDTIP